MAYTPPSSDALDFSIETSTTYSPPSSDVLDFGIGEQDDTISAPINLQVTSVPNGVEISWENTDNVTSGGYILHRFTDDGAFAFAGTSTAGGFNDGTWGDPSFVTDSIDATDTSYVDTNVPDSDVDYRLYRYNNGQTEGSELVSYFTRSLSVSGDGAIDTTRSSIPKSRSLSISGTGDVETTRLSVTKPRSPSISGNGAIDTTVEKISKRIVSSNFGTGTQTTLLDLQEVFPDEQALDVTWDYQFDPRGFATEWFDESSEIPRDERGGFGVTFNGRLANEIELWIQHDTEDRNKGIITSDKKTLSKAEKTVVFDEREEYSDDGLFRVFVRGLRQDDVINQVDVGSVHENL